MTPTTMAPPAPVTRLEPYERPLTAADVAALPDELPTGPVLYELDNGRLVVMPPSSGFHGVVESRYVGNFFQQGEKQGHGTSLSGDVGIVLWRNPDRLVGADAVFVTKASLPLKYSPEGYLETIPELILEVVSKNDTMPTIESKIADYFRAGVKVVLVANPFKKTGSVYRPDQPPQVLTEQDTLTIEDIIPGFKMPVAEAFSV